MYRIILISIVVIFATVGCKITETKVIDYANNNPLTKDKICGQPIKDTVFIKGRDIIKIDTVIPENNYYLDSLIMASELLTIKEKYDSLKKSMKPIKIVIDKSRVDTVKIPDLVRENNARILGFSEGVKSVKPKIINKRHWSDTGFWILLSAIILFILGWFSKSRFK